MSSTIWLSIGFVLGGVLIGTALTQRVQACVEEYGRPCLIEQTWTGAKVSPIPPNTTI